MASPVSISSPNLFSSFRGRAFSSSSSRSASSSTTSTPRRSRFTSASTNGRMDGFVTGNSSPSSSSSTSTSSSAYASPISSPPQLPRTSQRTPLSANTKRSNLESKLLQIREELDDILSHGETTHPEILKRIDILTFQADLATELLDSMRTEAPHNPESNSVAPNAAQAISRHDTQAAPVAEQATNAQATGTDTRPAPQVNQAARPQATRPAERVDSFASKAAKFVKGCVALVILAPILVTYVAVVMTAITAAITARKVVSIPISWPLLVSRLMGVNFEATKIKNNKLLNALLGPATIDALTSPTKHEAAAMLAFEVAAVALAAGTLGMGSFALTLVVPLLSPIVIAGLSIPDLAAYGDRIEAAEANRQNNRQTNQNNNSSPAVQAAPQAVPPATLRAA